MSDDEGEADDEDLADDGGAQSFDRRMLEALVCPHTHAPLRYDADAGELISRAAHLAYPIRGGIPVMLVDEARQTE